VTVFSLAAWTLSRRPATRLSPRDRSTRIPELTHLAGVSAPAAAALTALAVAAGASFGDRPTILGALAICAVVSMAALLSRRLASRALSRVAAANAERDALKVGLDAAREMKEEFRSLAYHDELTGLPNRSLLQDRLGLAIAHSARQATQLAVLFLDLDDFKAVNDSFGHASGDQVLVELAARIRASVRAGDTVARLGGDEFVVLLADVAGAQDAGSVATKVLAAVRAPFRLGGREISISASVGVSVFPRDGKSPEDLVRYADSAMYREKQRQATPGLPVVSQRPVVMKIREAR
jgi:diguanylate cyclase (GGDEF)-like protein